jgi:hypothetical protein
LNISLLQVAAVAALVEILQTEALEAAVPVGSELVLGLA